MPNTRKKRTHIQQSISPKQFVKEGIESPFERILNPNKMGCSGKSTYMGRAGSPLLEVFSVKNMGRPSFNVRNIRISYHKK